MDRNTLFAFALIAVILILTPWYMSVVSPVSEPTASDSLSTLATGDLQTNKKTSRSAATPFMDTVNSEPLSSTPETVIAVENGLYSAQISNINGGSFVSFVLNDYVKYDSSFVNLIDALNTQNLVVGFVSLDGDLVSLDRPWTVLSSGLRMSARKKQQTVVFETSFNGRSIKKQLTFSPGTYIIGRSFLKTQNNIFLGEPIACLGPAGSPQLKKTLKTTTHILKGMRF